VKRLLPHGRMTHTPEKSRAHILSLKPYWSSSSGALLFAQIANMKKLSLVKRKISCHFPVISNATPAIAS
jgi:hypothetical protein